MIGYPLQYSWASMVAHMVMGSIPGFERSPGEGKGYPVRYSGLENSTDGIVHGVTESRTWLREKGFPELSGK